VTPKSAIEVAFPSTGKISRAVYCCRRQAKSFDGAARLQHGSQETEEIPAEHLDNILLPKSALEQAFRDVRQVVLILEGSGSSGFCSAHPALNRIGLQ
jgi:hypothetical protein